MLKSAHSLERRVRSGARGTSAAQRHFPAVAVPRPLLLPWPRRAPRRPSAGARVEAPAFAEDRAGVLVQRANARVSLGHQGAADVVPKLPDPPAALGLPATFANQGRPPRLRCRNIPRVRRAAQANSRARPRRFRPWRRGVRTRGWRPPLTCSGDAYARTCLINTSNAHALPWRLCPFRDMSRRCW
eukprot:6188649-Pleurochrysis_carterae.AAC.3